MLGRKVVCSILLCFFYWLAIFTWMSPSILIVDRQVSASCKHQVVQFSIFVGRSKPPALHEFFQCVIEIQCSMAVLESGTEETALSSDFFRTRSFQPAKVQPQCIKSDLGTCLRRFELYACVDFSISGSSFISDASRVTSVCAV